MIIKVRFYSGYRGEESPRAIVVAGREYPVEQLLWRKRCLEKKTGESYDLFRCRVAGKEVTLRISSSGECRVLGSRDLPFPPLG